MILEQKWDTAFFEKKIGKIDKVTSDADLRKSLAQALEQQFRYLTCRIMANEISAVQLLERHGFYLVDVGIVLEKNIEQEERPLIRAQEGTVRDTVTLRTIASGIFKSGRFYQDLFFTEEDAERFYQTWAENSVKGLADKVFLISTEGFITCKVLEETGEISLVGVRVPDQGKGIGTALVQNALCWFNDMGLKNVTVRTQAGNNQAIKFYEYLGFRMEAIDVTMAKILNP